MINASVNNVVIIKYSLDITAIQLYVYYIEHNTGG